MILCAACDGPVVNHKAIPLIGIVCGECLSKLSEPHVQEGIVSTLPIADLAGLYSAEFEARRLRVIELARLLCKVNQ